MGNRKASDISRLEKALQRFQREVDALLEERAALQRRNAITRLTLRHYDAVLELSNLLQAQEGPLPWHKQAEWLKLWLEASGSGAEEGASCSQGVNFGGPDQGSSCSQGGRDNPEHQSTCDQRQGSTSAAPQATPPAFEPDGGLRWSPAAAAAALATTDLSTEGMLSKLASFVSQCSCLLPRMRRKAPDAAAAAAKLEGLQSDLMERMVLLAIHDRSALAGLVLSPIPVPAVEGAKPAPPPPADAHWEWAASQLDLDGEQMALVMTALDLWAVKYDRITNERRVRMAEVASAAGPSDPGAAAQDPEALLLEVDVLMWAGIMNFITTWLTIFTSIVRPEQFAAYMVACAPWAPSLPPLRIGLVAFRESRGRGGPAAGGRAAAAAAARTAPRLAATAEATAPASAPPRVETALGPAPPPAAAVAPAPGAAGSAGDPPRPLLK